MYDPSASLRAGSGLAHGSADSRQRYCANLGHRQDDETGTYTGSSPDGDGLVYMRARYYEPTTGRFVSEDPGRHGANWYAYCSANPVSRSDNDGRSDDLDQVNQLIHNPIAWIIGIGVARAIGILAKLANRGANELVFRLCCAMEKLGNAWMGNGIDMMEDGADMLNASMEGGSLGQMFGSGLGGVAMMMGGAVQFAAGLELLVTSRVTFFLMLIDLGQ